MRYLDYIKKYQNIDSVIALFDELGFKDEQIIAHLEVSKQSIYNAKERLQPLLETLKAMAEPKAKTYGNPDVNSIIEAFKSTFGTTKASIYDRYAAKRLADKHGADNIVAIIKALASIAGDKYTPSVNNVSDLEKKWVQIGKAISNNAGTTMVEL